MRGRDVNYSNIIFMQYFPVANRYMEYCCSEINICDISSETNACNITYDFIHLSNIELSRWCLDVKITQPPFNEFVTSVSVEIICDIALTSYSLEVICDIAVTTYSVEIM